MRTILFLSAVLIFGLASCNNNIRTIDEGVVINGVRWATNNVETPGTFAKNPESAGGFFTWDEAQNACPRGWRLPTADELQILHNATDEEWTARRGVNGRTFGIAPNRIFLPAAGARNTYGTLFNVGSLGYYWGSSPRTDATLAPVVLLLQQSNSDVPDDYAAYGISVRCVAE